MQDFLTFISDFGFPAFVAGYVLTRLEPTIKSLERSVNMLTYVLAKQSGVDYQEARKICDKNGGV